MADIKEYYQQELLANGFTKEKPNDSLNPIGDLYSIPAEIGKGNYWVYAQKDLYDIKIHDFYFYEDSFFDLEPRECLGICSYESVSGEELSPYRRLSAGMVKCFIGGGKPCRTVIHKNIPLRTVDIEILPAYMKNILRITFPTNILIPVQPFTIPHGLMIFRKW